MSTYSNPCNASCDPSLLAGRAATSYRRPKTNPLPDIVGAFKRSRIAVAFNPESPRNRIKYSAAPMVTAVRKLSQGLEGKMTGRFWASIFIGLAWSSFLLSPHIARAEGQGCASNNCSKECAGACKTKWNACDLKARTMSSAEQKGKTNTEQTAIVKKRRFDCDVDDHQCKLKCEDAFKKAGKK